MTLLLPIRTMFAVGLLALASCGEPAPERTPARGEGPATAQVPPVGAAAARSRFDPLLQSAALKDAIHRALTTGRTQRWADGGLSGYAVPSIESLPNGCKTIRYTVDQRPDAPMTTINACEGSK